MEIVTEKDLANSAWDKTFSVQDEELRIISIFKTHLNGLKFLSRAENLHAIIPKSA